MGGSENAALRIFISHSSPEHALAAAWKSFVEALPLSAEAWYSSDTDPRGGVGLGRWRDRIRQQLERSNAILVLFSPESVDRPWIFFEAAYAMGLGEDRLVIPIVYGMEVEQLPSPLREEQAYRGDRREDIAELSERMYQRVYGGTPPDELRASWLTHVDEYLEHVEAYSAERTSRALFRSGFHAATVARRMAGTWYANWTYTKEDGSEGPWQEQELEVDTTESRIRMVGFAAQGVLTPYEGVVSPEGRVALSYWVQGETAICGTVLLHRVGSLLRGTWEGFTALSLRERLSYHRGHVVMARDKAYVSGMDALEIARSADLSKP